MRLFYTVASSEDAQQSSPLLSLGGFRSSSLVPNGSFNSLFSDISTYSIQKNLVEYIGLILQNTFDKPVNSISIWIPKIESNFCKFRLSVVELDSKGEMEMIPSINSKPVYAEFYETSEEDKFEMPNILQPGDMLGLWIERSFDEESEEFLMRGNCDYLYEMIDKKPKYSEGSSIKVSFEYGS